MKFETRLENAMRANDLEKAKEILAYEFRKATDQEVTVNYI